MLHQCNKSTDGFFAAVLASQALAEIGLAIVAQTFAAGLAKTDGVTIMVVIASHPISEAERRSSAAAAAG
jgi:hypothetical protein